MSSQLHDVGKISIKDNILMKPDRLTGDEFDKMKWHATSGMNIIMKIEETTKENAFLKHARIMAGSHHEKWDGSGYFLGLKGEDIPLQGRLMSIVDVYDALTNDRPYKKAVPHKEAIKVIEKGIGSHFDPRIGEIFSKYEAAFERASRSGALQHYSGMGATDDISSSVISAVANIVDARTEKTGSSTGRIQDYLRVFIEALLHSDRYKNIVSHWDVEIFLLSAQLHDVGKIAVDDDLLNKAGALTSDEFEKVKSHAGFGARVIDQISQKTNKKDLLRHAEIMAGSHHERWDGTGYPLGLKGEAIPLQGRLMAIIDVYEALTCDRPHRKKVSHQMAIEIIQNQKGRHFDPNLVEIFIQNENRFLEAASTQAE
jgi:response regulator RpfG family c-di-GMP phosphodiesterase